MKSSGFTLLECLVAILMIGLLTFFSFSVFSNFLDRGKLRAEVEQTVMRLRQAKVTARALSQDVSVVCQGKTFKFAPSGNPVPGFFGTVEIKNRSGSKKVVVSAVGRIRVE